jgi:hypothetical protein
MDAGAKSDASNTYPHGKWRRRQFDEEERSGNTLEV